MGRLREFFTTRVARRVMALFVVSAFVPVAALAGISFRAVTGQLERQSQERLRQLAKNGGQSILQRLQRVEAGLRAAATLAGPGGAPAVSLDVALPEAAALALQDASGEVRPLAGARFAPPALTPEERALLAAGTMVLTPPAGDPPELAAAVAADPATPGRGTLWALLHGDSIWGSAETFAALPTVAEFCFLAPDDRPVHCTSSGGSSLAAAYAARAQDVPLGTFVFDGPDEEYIVGYWSFHPAAAFGTPPWAVLVAESAGSVLAPLEGFAATFAMVLLLGLSTVLLLANVQIRRTMEPLAALEAGTRRLAGGDLATRVTVEAEDEFGALAGSFNAMAGHLQAQFTQLDAGRAIDRAVLGAFDPTEVVRTVLARLPSVVPCRSVAVLLAGRHPGEPAALHRRTGGLELPETTLRLTTEDLDWLRAHARHGIADGRRPPFAAALRSASGGESLTVLPFVVKGNVRGALVLESEPEAAADGEGLSRARQLADQAAVALDDALLVEELEDLGWGALRAFARAIDAKSKWTAGHSERVTDLALRLGGELGLGQADMDALHRGGLLHDVGKIGVPAAVLDVPHRLTAEERSLVERHPTIGARILEPVRAFGPVLPIVLQHHERWDGKGYPRGLAGEEIHPLARVVAVADVYDALASARPYREALRPDMVLAVIRESGGTQFDPRMSEAFLDLMASRGLTPATAPGSARG